MQLLPWCQEQSWWPIILPMLENGMTVVLHVPNTPPKLKLKHTATGGMLILHQCKVPWYHIHTAWPMEAQADIERILAVMGLEDAGPVRVGHA